MRASKLAKHKATILLGAIVVVAVFQAFCQNTQVPKSQEPAAPAVSQKTPDASVDSTTVSQNAQKKLMVYYFYTSYRCPSCMMIENLTKTAVQTGYKDLIDKGRVEFKAINIEQKGNEHFAKEYKLYTKSVVISDHQNKKELRWKNLDQVWTLLRDENKFIDYIQREVKAYLEG